MIIIIIVVYGVWLSSQSVEAEKMENEDEFMHQPLLVMVVFLCLCMNDMIVIFFFASFVLVQFIDGEEKVKTKQKTRKRKTEKKDYQVNDITRRKRIVINPCNLFSAVHSE